MLKVVDDVLRANESYVMRNAGGRASDDAIRSLVISYKLLGTREWFVIHHTDCGMLTFTNDIMRDLLAKSLQTARIENGRWTGTNDGAGSDAGQYIQWSTSRDLAQCLVDDVIQIRTQPVVPSRLPIYAFIYDISNGKLINVPEATQAGESSAQARAALG